MPPLLGILKHWSSKLFCIKSWNCSILKSLVLEYSRKKLMFCILGFIQTDMTDKINEDFKKN